jgi:hypothetical protein
MANVRLTLTDGRPVDLDAATIGAMRVAGTGTVLFITDPPGGDSPADFVRLTVTEAHGRVRELVDIARSGG